MTQLIETPAKTGAESGTLWIRAVRWAGLVILILSSVWGAQQLAWGLFWGALRQIDFVLLLLGSGFVFVMLLFKSERWRLMLGTSQTISPFQAYYYLVVAYTASLLLPGPVGTGARIFVLKKHHRVLISTSTAVLVIEKLFDGFGLVFWVVWLPLLLPLPCSISVLIYSLCVAGVLVMSTAVLVARRINYLGLKWQERLKHLVPGFESLRSLWLFIVAVGLSVGSQAMDGLSIHFLLRSMNIDIHWASSFLLILAFSFAMVLPLTPGHVGALEGAAVGALALLGVPAEKALAFAVVYHMSHMIPLFLFGLGGARKVQKELVLDAASSTNRNELYRSCWGSKYCLDWNKMC